LTAEDSNNSAIDQISQSTNDYETAHHLQECGLKILNISLQSFWLPEETEIAIQHHWQPHTKQLVNGLQLLQQQKTVLYQELGEMQAVYAFLRETGRLD
jgi:molybdenum cofactor biosynthesis enzyme MoaA